MELIGYARANCDQGRLNEQISKLKTACCTQIYSDVMSGKAVDRPGLMDAIYALEVGDIFVVTDLTRISRDASIAAATLNIILLRAAGFRSLDDGIDISPEAGEIIIDLAHAYLRQDLVQVPLDLTRLTHSDDDASVWGRRSGNMQESDQAVAGG